MNIHDLGSLSVSIISSLNCLVPPELMDKWIMKYEVCTWIGFPVSTLAENLFRM